MPFEIHRTLMLSTTHLPAGELAAVEAIAILTGEYGWLVYVFSDIDAEETPSLAAAVALAIRETCDFVRFDSDGPLVAELPTFVW